MAEIKAFNALRFTEKAGEIGSLCCPPYDIISKEQREEFLEANPNNIIRLELPNSETVENDEAYRQARACLNNWLSDGILKKDDRPGIYIYGMDFKVDGQSYSLKGFISLVKLHEFSDGVILPHEETLSKAKQDRFSLMRATACNFSQIYSLYNDDGSVSEIIASFSSGEPEAAFTDRDNVTHKLWPVYDESNIKRISQLMADKKLYIADGHHRYETALAYKKYCYDNMQEPENSDYVMMMMVDMENPGLVVFPTHRVVRGLEGFNYNELVSKCSDMFEITPYLNREKGEIGLSEAYKAGKIAFVLFTGDNNYTLMVLKDKGIMSGYITSDCTALRELDVSVLHSLVLEKVLGIDKENMANQINLFYTRSADEAISMVDQQRANCCFLINPTKVNEIKEVAAAGEKMPQKSTYFYPKLTTGLVMNKIF